MPRKKKNQNWHQLPQIPGAHVAMIFYGVEGKVTVVKK